MFSGDKESGKTTLIAKLQGNEDPKKGSGLEYGYIDVRDEYREGEKINFFLAIISYFTFFTYHTAGNGPSGFKSKHINFFFIICLLSIFSILRKCHHHF